MSIGVWAAQAGTAKSAPVSAAGASSTSSSCDLYATPARACTLQPSFSAAPSGLEVRVFVDTRDPGKRYIVIICC